MLLSTARPAQPRRRVAVRPRNACDARGWRLAGRLLELFEYRVRGRNESARL